MKKRILIVDDDREIRTQMSRILRPQGYKLDFAADGASCLIAAQKVIPDLVILDLGLPREDGVSIIRKMRRIESLAEVPVLVVTGRDPAIYKQIVMDEAVAGFFSKPILEENFLAMVEEVFEQPSESGTPAVECPICSSVTDELPAGIDPRVVDWIASKVAGMVISAIQPLLPGPTDSKTPSPPASDAAAPIYVEIDDEIASLIPGFFGRRRDDCKTLLRAVEAGDFEMIGLLGHRMSGNGGGFGFQRISEIGAALERAAENLDAEESSKLITSLEDFLSRVQVVRAVVTQ